MLLGFESLVAIRFLREGRMQTLLIIVGVAAGVAVVAYISALITGLQRNTIEKTLGAQAHVTVSPLDERVLVAPTPPGAGASKLAQTQARAQRPRSIDNWQLLLAELEAMPQVAAVSPMVSAAGLAVRGEASRAIALMGVELERYDRIVKLRSRSWPGPRGSSREKASSGSNWRRTWACRWATGSASWPTASRMPCGSPPWWTSG